MRDASPRFSVRLGFDVTDDKRDKILEVLKERGLDELLVERMNEDGNCGSEIPSKMRSPPSSRTSSMSMN